MKNYFTAYATFIFLLLLVPAVYADAQAYPYADVVSVETEEVDGSYTFGVEVDSPDKGCDQYANWWEILSADGKLIYRRLLAHSHTDEQPFIRDGGPVNIMPDSELIIRAHMHPSGYGGKAYKGSVDGGFVATDLPPSFAAEVLKQPPFADYCAG